MPIATEPFATDDSLPEDMVREALAIEPEGRIEAADTAAPTAPARMTGKADAGDQGSQLARAAAANDDAWGGNKLDRSYGADPAPLQDAKPAQPAPACCGSAPGPTRADGHPARASAPSAGPRERDIAHGLDTGDGNFRFRKSLAAEMTAFTAGQDTITLDPASLDTTDRPLPPRQDGFAAPPPISRNQIEALLQIMLEPSVVSCALIALGVSLAIVSLRAIWVSTLMFVAAAFWFFYSNL
jgi:hypothetical protein